MNIKLKRTYDAPEADDGYRVLVDRLWPRGIKKRTYTLMNGLKPLLLLLSAEKHSTTIQSALIALCLPIQLNLTAILTRMPLSNSLKKLDQSTVTLLFSDKDTTYNNAVVLKKWLETKLK